MRRGWMPKTIRQHREAWIRAWYVRLSIRYYAVVKR
jgi:hypothetical protein